MIALVRHPPVEAAGRCYGRLDLPLREPVGALATRLRQIGFGDRAMVHDASLMHPTAVQKFRGTDGSVWTSPSQRCRRVAEACGPYHVDDRLAELDFGDWEGRLWDDVPRDALDAWAADPWQFAPPGGESGAELVARVSAFWTALPGGDHIVISHGGPLKVLVALAGQRPVDLLAAPPAWGSVTMVSRS